MMVLLNKIIDGIIIILLSNLLQNSWTVTVTRGIIADSLECTTNLNCNNFNGETIDNNTCSCNKGTFMYVNGQFTCVKDGGKTVGCNFFFNYFENQVQMINVEGESVGEFLYDILLDGKYCNDISLQKVEMLGVDYKWKSTPALDFEISNLLGTRSFFLRWKSGKEKAQQALSYKGELLKFSLTCTKDDGSKINSCVLGKVKGQKSWAEDGSSIDVCSTVVVPIQTTKILPSTKTTATPKSDSSNSNMGMIGGLVGAIVLLLIAVIILAVCFFRKRKRKTNDNQNQQITKTSTVEMYEKVDTEKSQFENMSYLTSLNTNPHKNMPPRPEEEYSSPYVNNNTNGAMQYSKLKRKDVEKQIAKNSDDYENADNEYTTLNELKVPGSSPTYQRLSTCEVPGYEDMKGNTSDGEYAEVYPN